MVWHGPFRVLRGSEPIDVDAPFLYMLSAFPFFGALVADGIDAGWRKRSWSVLAPIGVCAVLGVLRLALGLPVSGHALLLGYFSVVSAWQVPRWLAHLEVVAAMVCLAAIGTLKIAVWDDWQTFVFGLGAGSFGGLLVRRFAPEL